MIHITLPDGTIKEFDAPPTGLDVAQAISDGLARNCVAMELDGQVVDLTSDIRHDARLRLITTRDPEAVEILRHSAAHVMAQAILHLYPDAKLTIGPAVENGFYYDIDMAPVSEEDFPAIEAEIQRIIKAKLPFKRRLVPKEEALAFYRDEPYKLEMIGALQDGQISFYSQGDFTDLCRGPHLPHTGFVKAIKLMKVSGAYWRADQNNAQLQRIYGTAFFDKKQLKEYLTFIEEAKKRNHRKIGEAMALFSFHEEAPGMPFFHAKGMVLWNCLLDYWREEHRAAGYVETKTPILLNRALWERSGHWENYRENMYTTVVDEEQYAIKPMNCPGGMLIFKNRPHSYKDFPIRAAEVGLVHRHELSGVLSGLFRVRAFHQDDAHIFMTPEQIQDEILGVLRLVERIYSTFGLGFHLELSTRPEKSIGTDAQWSMATEGLESALKRYGRDYKINTGDGAFYGPKIDIHIKDAIGRRWQLSTIQVDFAQPENFDLEYATNENTRERPVMIHRALLGSVERFVGILVEHYAGAFPAWLSPVQATVIPVADRHTDYARTVEDRLVAAGVRVHLDVADETVGEKLRKAITHKHPVVVVVGDADVDAETVGLRIRGEDREERGIPVGEAISRVASMIAPPR